MIGALISSVLEVIHFAHAHPVNAGFDRSAGVLVAPVMARLNRDMEQAALQAAPSTDGRTVLIIGCGPGVGITEIFARCEAGSGPRVWSAAAYRSGRGPHGDGRPPDGPPRPARLRLTRFAWPDHPAAPSGEVLPG